MAARWALVALSLVAATCGAEQMSTHYECIVVGMGSAGTTAASTLARAGRRVLALEAAGRVGGRVHTVSFGGGVVELGAEWIHGTDSSRTYKTAVENNVTVQSQALDFEVVQSDGSVGSKLMHELVAKGIELTEEDHDDTPEPLGQYVTNKFTEYIKEKHPSVDNATVARVLDFLDLYVDNLDASSSWMDVDAAAPYDVLGGDQHVSWGRLGYKTFFELMLNTYKGGPGLPSLDLKLNSLVTRVHWPQQGGQPVAVTTSDGRTYTADAAIVTVSLGVLKEKHATLFSPPLPEDKKSAIENIGMGVIGKIILAFDKPWWGKKFYGLMWKPADLASVGDADRWTTRIMGISSPMGCENALTLWTSGETAKLVETLPEERVRAGAMALLRRFFSDLPITEPTAMIRSKWYANELTRGTYSYSSMAAAGAPDARRVLATPLPAPGAPAAPTGSARLLLAGEATHSTRYSTVHGAADSGYAAAAILLGDKSA
ncbi:spermine oxidase-like isoform X2 [Pectinophora gossypiella]|uniref:spermine oxidase-like isoform X2 n=1 Tax=Pectinophora gossypiella TaxID=13191 RepID=UPI00214ED225|nr:spermine oxidase-like isoform X2 [Pectinophora gossypiella]